MKDLDHTVFVKLLNEAHTKCFGHPMTTPLSETESKLLCNRILEQTGLVIGVKSVKNYSAYILNSAEAKKENPSVATLDTLARYVSDAPYTDEVRRKTHEAHYPYWFQYKNKLSGQPARSDAGGNWRIVVIMVCSLLGISSVLFLVMRKMQNGGYGNFTDQFTSVHEDSLAARGWIVKSKDTAWWERRGEHPGYLQLFTLRGDNWPDSMNAPGISNLVLREISGDCFTTEIHLDNFIPSHRWQQAGILLLEDTTDTSKGIRLSLGYNDFFGGFERPAEIIIQAIRSSESGGFNYPEEIAHLPVLGVAPLQESLVKNNLRKSALKIEKAGNHFRFLFSIGPVDNFAFKEVVSRDLPIRPKYIGLFAIQGFVSNQEYAPVKIDLFNFTNTSCD